MSQLSLFPAPARTSAPTPAAACPDALAACPRCRAPKTNAWGWVVSFNPPAVRCPDCWELEP